MKQNLTYNPPRDPLNILYQDDDLLVLSKPAGLLSVPGRVHKDSLESRAKAEFPNALLVHRLDMDTSGVFVMALNKAAQTHLSKQFATRTVKKTYIAKVWGAVKGDEGCVDLPLRCDWPNRPLQMVCYEHGKPAQTNWRVLERGKFLSRLPRGSGDLDGDEKTPACAGDTISFDWTLVELIPLTGRSHQLRVHMMAIGHPILGDVFYAEDEALAAADRLCLHAERLVVKHPRDERKMEFYDRSGF